VIEKLKSHLRSKKGFTLIELLIVIAIIAVLVLIVVVAINPVQRLQDAANRTAASNVRATGTLIGACITSVLSTNPPGTVADCDSPGELDPTYGSVPQDTTVIGNLAGTGVCAIDEGAATTFQRYQSLTGEVDDPPSATGLTDCPDVP